MDTEKLNQFFELIKDKPLTVGLISNAVKAIGHAPDVIPAILAFAEYSNIDIKKELTELTHAQEEAAHEKAIKEATESIAEKITCYQESVAAGVKIDSPELLNLAGKIEKDATTLAGKANKQDRIGTWEGFMNECLAYEPEKEFTPELFNKLSFPPGTISYIGARAKVGKTNAMINLSKEALFDNRKVFFITLEMSRKQLLLKLILCMVYTMARGTGAENDLIKRGSKDRYIETKRTPTKDLFDFIKEKNKKGELAYFDGDAEFKELANRAIEIIMPKYKKDLFIFDGRGADFQEITGAIKIYATPESLVLLDYIQRMPSADNTGHDDYTRVKKISDGVLTAATLTQSIIISGAQFNRETAKTKSADGDEIIDLSHFRESGDIEQDGHNLIGIGRMAVQGSRYIKILAAREALVENDAYSMDFSGAYSYMTRSVKIDAPIEGRSKSMSEAMGIGRITKREKEAVTKAIMDTRNNDTSEIQSPGNESPKKILTRENIKRNS